MENSYKSHLPTAMEPIKKHSDLRSNAERDEASLALPLHHLPWDGDGGRSEDQRERRKAQELRYLQCEGVWCQGQRPERRHQGPTSSAPHLFVVLSLAAFLAAWDAACKSSGQVKILIPSGTYFLNPIEFNGPCRDVQSLKFQMQGTLRATTDLRKYGNGKGWVEFRHVDGLTVTGGGTFDGQGAVSWPFNKCPKDKNCKVLPTSVKFVNTKDTVVRGITSLNSKFFHMALLGCHNFKGSGITISAPGTSPNTDGIHLEGSTGVTISSSKVATGDDCISIGQGNSLVTISGITCGPGHGISIGSLGRYNDEEDVKNVIIKDSTFQGTTNGVRIKTWANSPAITKVQNMTFDNLVMKNVDYPIVIDQTYCPFAKCDNSRASRVKLSDIHFKNIRGTTKRPEAVILRCSKGTPCQKLSLHNINLKNIGSGGTLSTCLNAKAEYSGNIFPPPCQ